MNKICKHCQCEYYTQNKKSKYCSLSCFGKINGQTKPSPDVRAKMSASGKARYGNRPTKKPMSPDERYAYLRKFWFDKMMETEWDDLPTLSRFKRVKEEQNHACNGCNLSEWRNQPITLEIEHKDGNNRNNSRDNLEALCPNCHSQTSTWRGRNKQGKVTDEDMIKALKSSDSITQALKSLRLAPKGGNFKRAKRLANIPEDVNLSTGKNNITDFK